MLIRKKVSNMNKYSYVKVIQFNCGYERERAEKHLSEITDYKKRKAYTKRFWKNFLN